MIQRSYSELNTAMKIKVVLRVLAFVCVIVSCVMIFPLMLAIYDGSKDVNAFTLSLIVGITFSLTVIVLTGRNITDDSIGIREGLGVTGFSWIIASVIGALPYWLSGCAVSYVDAFFETMSGFTTTGATIFTEIETLPRGILLWRSLTHWMGGMGIIVLSLAVLPFLGVSGMEMYKAEVPGVTAGKLTPRLHQTAIYLWGAYILLTLSETVLLLLGGMTLFDAFCHSCSTIATGGFSTKDSSIAYFSNGYIQWVIIIFMFLSGINFSLYFLIPKKTFHEIIADEELRGYIAITIISSVAISLCLYMTGVFTGIEYTVRQSIFHVVSVMTTTGFIVEDHDKWPEFTKFIIIILMFIGASGGSTGGGCKVSRFLIIGRQLKMEVKKLLHPKTIITPRMNGRPIAQSTMRSSTAFFVLYMLMLSLGTLITTAYGIDILTSFTGILTCLSNVGPGIGGLGATESFSWLPDGVKWLMSFCMLAGRLELFAIFLLFFPNTYRK